MQLVERLKFARPARHVHARPTRGCLGLPTVAAGGTRARFLLAAVLPLPLC